ncbi:MAG: metallophosphoesterase, partial [Bacteroidales bacterium]
MEVTKNYSIKKMIQTIFILSLTVIIVSCSQNDKNEMQVAILHTNDMHASIDNMDKLAAYKQQMDKKYDHVFLVSAGDIFSGNPVVDEYEQKGYPIIDLMNKAGYNLSAIGNHEFDYGQEVLAERMEEANFPFICANIKTEGTSLPQPDPYSVLEAGGKKIFILSQIEIWNDGQPSTHPMKLK